MMGGMCMSTIKFLLLQRKMDAADVKGSTADLHFVFRLWGCIGT